MCPYDPNIPQATDQQSVSQGQILVNFQAINTLVDANHYTFGSGATLEGKHKFVSMPVQGAAPAFLANENGLYTLLNATTNQNETYINKQNLSGPFNVPMTASILSTSNPALGANGWTYLPSGILLMWATYTGINGNSVCNVLSGANIPSFNNLLAVVLCPWSTNTSDDNFAVRLVDIRSVTQFRVFVSSRTSTGAATGGFQALLIGY